MKGKKHQCLLLTREKAKSAYPKKVCTLVIKSEIASHILKEKLPPIPTPKELSQNL